jgi:GH24 family phage-related lysozyme (muramidase)
MQIKRQIEELVRVNLTNSQFEALESFVSSQGIAIFRNSALLKAINRNDTQTAVEEFRKWILQSGRPSVELADLREKEISLFTK